MKQFGFTLNIDNKSNIIISHAEADWSFLRHGDLIIIDDDKIFHTVLSREKMMFIQPFEKIENNKIAINGNYEFIFIVDDILNLSHKEYELLTVKSIIDKGENYKKDDIISLSGGTVSVDIVDNSSETTLFKVEQVDAHGGVLKLNIINKGLYSQFPEKENLIHGGSGKNLKISVEEKITDSRKLIERQVTNVEQNGARTILSLNYSLPDSVVNGKVSVQKWKAVLASEYLGESKRNVEYTVVRDSTPYLHLPLVVKGSDKLVESFNDALKKIDSEISRLKSEIEKLKPK